MGVGPPEPPRRGRFQTTSSCAGTMAGVVNVEEKALLESVKCELRKANESKPADDASRMTLMMSKPGMQIDSGQIWGEPACCPGGIRRIGGASPVQASTWNVGSCDPDTAPGEADG
jgi:hypothetical protein